MTTVTFLNFTNEDFTWNWDNVPFTFKAGESKRMESSQAKHFAKHLTNRELLKAGKENYTSPKFPDQVPEFMTIFNKIIIDESAEIPEAKIEMEILNSKDKPFCEFCDSKGVAHKKNCTRNLVKEDNQEKEFEDLGE